MRFEFSTPTRIIFGANVARDLGAICKEFGSRPLLVTSQNPERFTAVVQSLQGAGLVSTLFRISGEPTIEAVQRGASMAREAGCDFVIGLGGGSAIDSGKAVSAMVPNPGDIYDYLEVVGRAKPLANPSIPCIAIPTTAGAGAEVTRNAVLASPEHRVKVSMRGPYLIPKVALIDPALTLTLPSAVTASTGLDALTQLIEPFVSSKSNPMTDALCREGMGRVARSLRQAYQHGEDLQAREDMCVASLFGGLALANAGLGAVHGFAGPIGGMFDAPHGAVCAALLPHVMSANVAALRQRAPALVSRFDTVAQILTSNSNSKAEDGVEWILQLVRDLKIPKLGAYGITREQIPALVEKAGKASSMKPNPISLTVSELSQIMEAAI